MERAVDVIKHGSHLYEVERTAEHATRPGFRITEMQISPAQKVPWHFHTNIQDTFCVIEDSSGSSCVSPRRRFGLAPATRTQSSLVVRTSSRMLQGHAPTASQLFVVASVWVHRLSTISAVEHEHTLG